MFCTIAEPLPGNRRLSGGRTAYVTHSDCSRHDTGWKHPEHQGRLPAIARAVHRDMLTLFDHLLEVEGSPATRDDLAVAHDPAYVERVEARVREAAQAGTVLPLEEGVMVSGATWDAVSAQVGCVWTAAERVESGQARNAFCAVRPPGHGAGRNGAGRYSIFNGVAIAALRLIRERGRRVLVIDLGAHAGVGTAEILHGEPAARMLSVAREGTAGAAGLGAVARQVGQEGGVEVVRRAVREGMEEALAGFRPDVVLLSLGFDGLQSDPTGGMGLVPRDYHDLTVEVRMGAEESCGGRLVSVLEEGYDAEGSARAVVQHLRALASLEPLPT